MKRYKHGFIGFGGGMSVEKDGVAISYSKTIDELNELDRIKNEIQRIANNALYFNDNSDYRSALFDVCLESGMEADQIGEKYIEEKE